MNESVSVPTVLASAGFSELGGVAAFFVAAFGAVFAPLFLIGLGSWAPVLGLCLLVIDVAAIILVGRPTYRLLHGRLHFPDWFIGVPLILAGASTAAIVNVCTMFVAAKLLPSSWFGFQ